MQTDYTLVLNHAELISVFGDWPSFHDAEVVSLILERPGPSLDLAIYVFRTTGELGDGGQFKLSNEVLVRMRFHGISELNLFDFNGQNVLGELYFAEEATGKRVRLHGLYGLSGDFLCEAIEVCGVDRLVGRPK